MGRFDSTKAAIDANIKKNDNQEITGSILNYVMNNMIDSTESQLEATDARITEVSDALTEASSEIEVLAIELESQNEMIADLDNMKIDKEADDYYPQLSVGLADNLAGQDVVDSEISFRRSGGGAISDGVARIEAIKGNSVVWNQSATSQGEVIHMDVQSLESVGVNQWDEEWESGTIVGSDGALVDDSTKIRTKNLIRVLPNKEYHFSQPSQLPIRVFLYGADKAYKAYEYITSSSFLIPSDVYYIKVVFEYATYNHDICINLSDAAINGEYYPYIKRVEDLAVIRKYFPEGMKSAGTAHDEIRYNKATQKWEKVEAVGVRAYQDGDADNTAYLTDGKVTCYPLAEPIVTEIEGDFNLDYEVWNGGTEKIVSDVQTTPLKAEIAYGFNAIGKIKELEEKLNNGGGGGGVSKDYVDGKLTELSAEIENLEDFTEQQIAPLKEVIDGVVVYDDKSVEPLYVDKYIYAPSGQVFGGNKARVSGLISLEQGKTIKVTIPIIFNTNSAAIAVQKEAGTGFYGTTHGKAVQCVTGVSEYEYTAIEDCNVVVSYNADGGFIAKIQASPINETISDIKNDIVILKETKSQMDGYVNIPLEIAQENKAINYSYGQITNANGFAYSKPIWLNKGETLKMSLVGGRPSGSYKAIVPMQYENAQYERNEGTRQDDNSFEYEYTAMYDCNVAVCFPMASEVTLMVKRVAIPSHLERLDGKEPTIVAPYHAESADGEEGSICNAEDVTFEQLDAIAQKICKEYSGVFNREVMGKDASGNYDVVRYIFTQRDYFAYKSSDKLFGWKSSSAVVYTKHYCPIPQDEVYNESEVSIGVVTSYNSTNQTMVVNGVSYTRDRGVDVAPNIIYALWDFKEAYISNNNTTSFFSKSDFIFDSDKKQIGRYSASNVNFVENTFTWNGVVYHRAASYDYSKDHEQTLVLWANEHAPQSDPAEPSIVLLQMMKDLASSVADTNPLLNYIKKHCKVVFIPVVNPWCMTERQRDGRSNFNRVNINRNYDYMWESVTDSDKGTYPGDQPETRYVMDTCGLFNADLAIDIHCLGYNSYINRLCWSAVLPEGGNQNIIQEMQRGYNKYLTIIGTGNGEDGGEGSGFICKNLGIAGGLIEMNAGIPEETLHCAGILQMNYDYLLKMIRLFMRLSKPTLYINK